MFSQFETGHYDLALVGLEAFACSAKQQSLVFNLITRLNKVSTESMLSELGTTTNYWEKFEDFLTTCHGLPSSRQIFLLEITCLLNWASLINRRKRKHSSSTVETLLIFLNRSLSRMFVDITKSSSSITRKDIESTISYFQVVFKRLSEYDFCGEFTVMTLNVMWLLLDDGFIDQPLQLFQLIQNHFAECACKDNIVERFIVSCDSIYSSLPNLTDISRLISGIILQKRPKEALNQVSLVKPPENLNLQALIALFQGCFRYNCGEYEEGLNIMIPKSKSNTSGEIESRICNAIGCCLSKMGKSNLSCQWFQNSIRSDVKNILPLWNVAEQFRKMGKSTAEIQVRSLLEKRVKVDHENDASHMEALYHLARRCLQLTMYQEAATYFQMLLRVLLKDGHNLAQVWKNIPCPSFSEIVLEAAYAYYHSDRFGLSMDLCQAFVDDYPESTYEMEVGRFRMLRSRLRETEFRNQNDALTASYINANCLYKLGFLEDATDALKSIQHAVSSLEGTEPPTEPTAKRPNMDIPLDAATEATLNELFEMTSKVSCNLAVLAIQKGCLEDAAHLLVVSTLSQPGNLDAWFNYALLLIKMGKMVEAKRQWRMMKSKNQELVHMIEGDVQRIIICSVSVKKVKQLDTILTES